MLPNGSVFSARLQKWTFPIAHCSLHQHGVLPVFLPVFNWGASQRAFLSGYLYSCLFVKWLQLQLKHCSGWEYTSRQEQSKNLDVQPPLALPTWRRLASCVSASDFIAAWYRFVVCKHGILGVSGTKNITIKKQKQDHWKLHLSHLSLSKCFDNWSSQTYPGSSRMNMKRPF